jgi:hypothetical protein
MIAFTSPIFFIYRLDVVYYGQMDNGCRTWERCQVSTEFQSVSLKVKNDLENLREDERIILKCILKNRMGGMN